MDFLIATLASLLAGLVDVGEGDFAFGSVPGYGQLGGALSIYDGAAKSLDTYAFDKSTTYAPGVNGSLLRDLAPISLAQHGGKIYMGTTNRGGHQMFAKTREAYVVEFDIAKRQVTAITQVFDQQVAVTGLTVGCGNLARPALIDCLQPNRRVEVHVSVFAPAN